MLEGLIIVGIQLEGVICQSHLPHFSNIFSPDQLQEKPSLVLLCGEPIVRLDRELDEDVPEMIQFISKP